MADIPCVLGSDTELCPKSYTNGHHIVYIKTSLFELGPSPVQSGPTTTFKTSERLGASVVTKPKG